MVTTTSWAATQIDIEQAERNTYWHVRKKCAGKDFKTKRKSVIEDILNHCECKQMHPENAHLSLYLKLIMIFNCFHL